MIILFISALLMVYCAQIFTFSFCLQGLNRAVINTPIELMYNTVSFAGSEGSFSKSNFEHMLMTYYDNILPRYSKSHEVSFYYYNPDDGSMCLTDTCKAVEISVKCMVTTNYEYNRTMYYELRRN